MRWIVRRRIVTSGEVLPDMGVKLMSQAFATELPTSKKMVLLVLCDYANDDGLSCRPSVSSVAKKASVSDRQCKRLMRELELDGLISVVANQNGGSPGSTRHYRIQCDRLLRLSTGDTHDTGDNMTRVTNGTETGDKCDKGRVTNGTETGDTGDTQPPKDPPVDPPRTPQGVHAHETESKQVLDYLNERTGSDWKLNKTNVEHLGARLTEGHTVDECKRVIDFKLNEWGSDPKMRQYLRPATLFRPSNFPGYLQAVKASPPANGHSGFESREYTEHVPDWAKEA
jgi:uncharacterized phage protein (TIGR02220 family)